MKEMLARHKGKLILSSLVILLPILPAAFAGQTLFLWEPVLLLVSQWVIMLVVLHANRNKEQSPKVLNLVAWILPVLSLLLGVVGQLAQGGADSAYLITALFTFFMGLLFFLIGNYMPKTKQNGAVGIRIKWTLESEENWDATHRYAGKLWCLGGLLLMVCALIPSVLAVILLWIVILAAMVILPTRYSYRFYKSQVAEGKVEKRPVKPRSIVLIAVLVLAFGAFLAWSLFTGDIQYVYGTDSLTVDASGWGDLTIPYSSVTSLEYFDQDPSQDASGFRTNGLGNFKVALGSFENDLYGDYTRYTFASCGACVVLARRRQHPGAVPVSFGKDRLGIIPGEHGKNRRNRWGPAGFLYGGVLAFLTLRPARRRSPPRRCAPSPRSPRRTQRFCRPQCGRCTALSWRFQSPFAREPC